MKRKTLMTLIFAGVFSSQPLAAFSATTAITNFKTLSKGCYQYTDILKSKDTTNGMLENSGLPEAFLGKQVIKVNCDTKHHLEIAMSGKSNVKGTLKLDTLFIKSKCLINNNSIANSGHEAHASQLYVNVWRVGKVNNFICGVNAKSYEVSTAPGYKIYEVFYSPVLEMSN